MPLLPAEPYIFPEALLTADAAADARWWALYTKPRAEKTLARQLLSRRLGFFLPVYHRQWRSAGHQRSAFMPLFPGYLFLHGDHDARRHALETNLVVHAIDVADQAGFKHDLQRVYRLVEHGTGLSPEDRLVPGTRVEVVSGALAGMEGTILRRGKKLKFIVEVQLLQRGVSAEIESWMFRPLADAKPLHA